MDHAHVRQRLQAFAARFRRAAGTADVESSAMERAAATREPTVGLRSMHTLGAGRR